MKPFQFSLAAMFAVVTGAAVVLGVCPAIYRVVSTIPTSDWVSWSGLGVLCVCGLGLVAAILYRG